MPRVVLFKLCSLLLVSSLLVAPAVLAAPSQDSDGELITHKPLKMKGFFAEVWQSATRLLRPQATTMKTTVTYVVVPYPPYLIPVTSGGAGAAASPDG
jgi:hypothetical protein